MIACNEFTKNLLVSRFVEVVDMAKTVHSEPILWCQLAQGYMRCGT